MADRCVCPLSRACAGEWTLHVDESGQNATLRNLVWPGYEYRLQAGCGCFHGAYYGGGERNSDLAFMV